MNRSNETLATLSAEESSIQSAPTSRPTYKHPAGVVSDGFPLEYGTPAMQKLAAEFLATTPQPRITSTRLRSNFPVMTFLDTAQEKVVISSRFKGIAIDFDGTIMKFNFTEGMRQGAFALTMDSFSLEATGQPLPREERIRIHSKAVNHPEKKMSAIIAEHLSPLIGHELTEKEVMSRWKQYSEVLLLSAPEKYGRPPKTAINKGIIPLLKGAQALGKPAGVCTAGDHDFVMPLIKAGHLEQFFNYNTCVFTSLHPEIRTKPYEDPYILVAKKMGIRPAELLVLEDSATGALAALRAGTQVILQPSGDREETLLQLAQTIQDHHSGWVQERTNAIIVLAEGAGFTQLVHEDA